MRVLIQIVKNASVAIDNSVVAEISNGMLLFVGFTHTDNEQVIDKIINKIIGLRIFPDRDGKTNLNLSQVNGQILSVSQFTLYGNVKDGKRPAFIDAMEPEKAKELYTLFNEKLSKLTLVKTGIFGADMKVKLLNDGPFTLLLDSKELWNI